MNNLTGRIVKNISNEYEVLSSDNNRFLVKPILGAGMVNNNVLKMCGYDPNIYQGFAFGVGIERIAMLKYGIEDIRTLYSNDLRQNKQFK